MTTSGARRRKSATEPSLPYEDWLIAQLKDPAEAAGYLEAVIEQGDQKALMIALRQVAMAQGGISAVARRAKVTREAAYRMLSGSGNPELRSLTAILAAAGLRLSVKPLGPAAKAAQKRARYGVVVPASEAWVHEPEVRYQLAKAAKWLKEARRSETSVDALARKGRKRK